MNESIHELNSWYLYYRPFQQNFDMLIHDLHQDIHKGEAFMIKVKTTIDQLFDYEQQIINQYTPKEN